MNTEEIYKNVFQKNPNYNVHISDKERYNFVINEVIVNNYKKIIDISSGRGFYIKNLLKRINNVDITSTDLFKFNNIDIKFIKLNLSNVDDYVNITEKYEFLSCLDVIEHVGEEHLDNIFTFFSKILNNFCFSIANHSDIENGIELHLIQKNKKWWDDMLSNYFDIKNSFVKYNNRLYCYVLKNK